MKRRVWRNWIRAALSLSFILVLAGIACAEVVVKGSEVSVMFGQAVAAEYMADYPGRSVDVSGGGKDNAIIMLAAGSCDIANSALSLAEQDRADVLAALRQAEVAGHPIVEIPIAIDCVDFFVHKDNPVTSMTLAQLKGIYEGTAAGWEPFGGTGTIHVYRSGDDDHKLFSIKKWLTDSIGASAEEVDKKLLFNFVAGNSQSIGYDGVYYTGDSLNKSGDVVHSLNIVGPSDAAEYAPSRKYPVSRNLYMFVRQGDISAEAQNFIDYLLSPKAQRIVGEYVSPVLPPAKAFEIAFVPNGKEERTVRFDEDVAAPQTFYLDYETAAAHTIYFRNNTLRDGTYPTLTGVDGGQKSLVNGGLFIVNRKSDPASFNRLMRCNITEITATDVARGDVLAFEYNGQKIELYFDQAPSGDSGSSGCTVGAAGLGMAFSVIGFIVLRRAVKVRKN